MRAHKEITNHCSRHLNTNVSNEERRKKYSVLNSDAYFLNDGSYLKESEVRPFFLETGQNSGPN